MAISDEFLSELRDRVGIEEVISPYVNLKRRGRTLVGLCPFHNEKTPSFTVYPDSSSFYCFGCGAGGDIISFVKRIENFDYVEAVKSIAQRAGMNMPEDGFDDSVARAKQRILAANREAARFFHESLYAPCGKEALNYLLGRGLTHQTIKHFGLGYSPNSWDSLITHMKGKGFSPIELVEANLARKSEKNGNSSYYDNFRNRFMTPIIDVRGNVIAFGGRVLDDSKPKYINTSDTLVYKKSKGVFALNFAKNGNSGSLILAEGYMDVIALHQAGFTNSVAGLGTALTREQAGLLSRYADEIILAYDSDGAGREAAAKAIRLFKETGVKIKVLRLTGGKDPDEIIKLHGRERFQSLITGAANDTEYKLLSCREKYDLETQDGKINFLEEAVYILAALESPIERDVYSSKLSDELSVKKEAIDSRISSAVVKRKRNREKETAATMQKAVMTRQDKLNPERAGNIKASCAEEKLIAVLLNNPDFYQSVISGNISPDDFITDLNRRIFEVLCHRLAEGKSIELTFLSGSFSDEELSRIAQLRSMSRELANTSSECADCIKVILDEKNKAVRPDPSAMSDEEWAKAIDRLKKS